jgi:hypothetical protein
MLTTDQVHDRADLHPGLRKQLKIPLPDLSDGFFFVPGGQGDKDCAAHLVVIGGFMFQQPVPGIQPAG